MQESPGRTPCPAPDTSPSRGTDVRRLLAEKNDLSPAEVVDLLGADQVERWRQGERVPAEAYLQMCPFLASDSEEALELVFGEVVLREMLGESPTLAEYLWRFPHFDARLRRQFELHRAIHEPVSSLGANREIAPPPDRAAGAAHWPAVANYEITGELGRGGMGVVYRAQHLQLKRPVALKMILGGHLAGWEAHNRFRAEAESAAKLQHPNIVQVYDIGEHAGQAFLALELVDGGNLAERLRGTPQSPDDSARLIETLAKAIHHAHRQGVVHRDLKPANVLLSGAAACPLAQCTPKIADFGLAKQVGRAPCEGGPTTATGIILGTAEYMAPEQARGDQAAAGPAIDVYSLGAILYELLTGRPPFKQANPLDTVYQVIHDEPVPPRRLQPRLPRDLETVCLKCLEKNPRLRYASAADLADDLRRFLDRQPVHARPVGVAGRVGRWCRRRPAVAALLAVVALGAATILGIFAISYRDKLDAQAVLEAARLKAEERDGRTRQILAALVRPNRKSSYQTLETHRSLSLAQLQTAASHYETLLEEEPADTALQTALADVYAGISFLHFEGWQLVDALNFGEQALGFSKPVADAPVAGGQFFTRTAAIDVYAGASMFHHESGQFEDAVAFSEKALKLRKQAAKAQPRNLDYRVRLAEAYHWKGLLHQHQAEGEQALVALERSCAVWNGLAQDQPTPDMRYNLACTERFLGEILFVVGRSAEAFEHVEMSRALATRLLDEQPGEKRYREHLTQTYTWLGGTHALQGARDEARRCWRQGYDLCKHWLAQQPGDLEIRRALGTFAQELIQPDALEPYYTEAIFSFESACKAIARLVEEEPTNRGLRQQLELRYRFLMRCHELAGQPARKVEAAEHYMRLLDSLASKDPHDEGLGLDLGHACGILAECYQAAGNAEKAVQSAQRGFQILEAWRPLGPANPKTANRRLQWAKQAATLAHAIRRADVPDKALQLAEQSQALLVGLLSESPEDVRFGVAMYHALEEIARARLDLDRPDEALTAWVESADVMRKVVQRAPSKLGYRQLLAGRCLNLNRHLRERGRLAEAAKWLLERETLLPADPQNLRIGSQEFALLAAAVGKGRTELTDAEKAEKERYLRLSARPASEIPAWAPPTRPSAEGPLDNH